MNKKTITSGKTPTAALTPAENYSLEPPLIGPVLKEMAYLLKLTPLLLAPLLKMKKRNIYKIFKRRYLTIPQMKKWSVVLKTDLFLLYRANVKPVLNALQEKSDELAALKIKNEELQNDVIIYKNRIIKLEGQLELREEDLKELRRK